MVVGKTRVLLSFHPFFAESVAVGGGRGIRLARKNMKKIIISIVDANG